MTVLCKWLWTSWLIKLDRISAWCTHMGYVLLEHLLWGRDSHVKVISSYLLIWSWWIVCRCPPCNCSSLSWSLNLSPYHIDSSNPTSAGLIFGHQNFGLLGNEIWVFTNNYNNTRILCCYYFFCRNFFRSSEHKMDEANEDESMGMDVPYK